MLKCILHKIFHYTTNLFVLYALFVSSGKAQLLSNFEIPFYAKSQYKRAVEHTENVKNKLYPKKNKIEISLMDFGTTLNQSYITSIVFHSGITYWLREDLGLTLDGLFSYNLDKNERHCIENFYNDYQGLMQASCPGSDENSLVHLFDSNGNPISGANFGPAYVNIRELDFVVTGAMSWSPIYGKQLAFMAGTVYFDLFFTVGLGAAFSKFYPKSQTLKNGNISRGELSGKLPSGGCPEGDGIPGVCPSDENIDGLVGVGGRPDFLSETLPVATFGIGQKFHFYDHYHFKMELRNYSIFSNELGYEPTFMLWVGFGLRI